MKNKEVMKWHKDLSDKCLYSLFFKDQGERWKEMLVKMEELLEKFH